jgi:hypothetical protein
MKTNDRGFTFDEANDGEGYMVFDPAGEPCAKVATAFDANELATKWTDARSIKLVRRDGIKFGTTKDGSDWGAPIGFLYAGDVYPHRFAAEEVRREREEACGY